MKSTILTAYVALGSRGTAYVANDGRTEYTIVEIGSGDAQEELKVAEQLRRINCRCTLKTDVCSTFVRDQLIVANGRKMSEELTLMKGGKERGSTTAVAFTVASNSLFEDSQTP